MVNDSRAVGRSADNASACVDAVAGDRKKTLSFRVPGEAVAKGRGRAMVGNGRVRVYTPSKTRGYENLVRTIAGDAMGASPPFSGAIGVDVTVVLPIPKSFSKRKQAAAYFGDLLPVKRPDIDNLCKSVLDGMNGIVFLDDAQICRLQVTKLYGRISGAAVRVFDLEESAA